MSKLWSQAQYESWKLQHLCCHLIDLSNNVEHAEHAQRLVDIVSRLCQGEHVSSYDIATATAAISQPSDDECSRINEWIARAAKTKPTPSERAKAKADRKKQSSNKQSSGSKQSSRATTDRNEGIERVRIEREGDDDEYNPSDGGGSDNGRKDHGKNNTPRKPKRKKRSKRKRKGDSDDDDDDDNEEKNVCFLLLIV